MSSTPPQTTFITNVREFLQTLRSHRIDLAFLLLLIALLFTFFPHNNLFQALIMGTAAMMFIALRGRSKRKEIEQQPQPAEESDYGNCPSCGLRQWKGYSLCVWCEHPLNGALSEEQLSYPPAQTASMEIRQTRVTLALPPARRDLMKFQ